LQDEKHLNNTLLFTVFTLNEGFESSCSLAQSGGQGHRPSLGGLPLASHNASFKSSAAMIVSGSLLIHSDTFSPP
jgi:hypothetical protein